MSALTHWMSSKNLESSNTQLSISLDRLDIRKQVRYFRVFVDDEDISRMVGDALGLQVSKGRGTTDCIIVHGCGMDMGFYVQSMAHSAAYREGFTNMFDAQLYKYLGRRKRP